MGRCECFVGGRGGCRLLWELFVRQWVVVGCRGIFLGGSGSLWAIM